MSRGTLRLRLEPLVETVTSALVLDGIAPGISHHESTTAGVAEWGGFASGRMPHHKSAAKLPNQPRRQPRLLSAAATFSATSIDTRTFDSSVTPAMCGVRAETRASGKRRLRGERLALEHVERRAAQVA